MQQQYLYSDTRCSSIHIYALMLLFSVNTYLSALDETNITVKIVLLIENYLSMFQCSLFSYIKTIFIVKQQHIMGHIPLLLSNFTRVNTLWKDPPFYCQYYHCFLQQFILLFYVCVGLFPIFRIINFIKLKLEIFPKYYLDQLLKLQQQQQKINKLWKESVHSDCQ